MPPPCGRAVASASEASATARASFAVPGVLHPRSARRRGGQPPHTALLLLPSPPPAPPCRACCCSIDHNQQQQQPLFLLLRRVPCSRAGLSLSRRGTTTANTAAAGGGGAGAAAPFPSSSPDDGDARQPQQQQQPQRPLSPRPRPPPPGLAAAPATPLARLAALAAELLTALWRFLRASAALLPQFSRPSPGEALRRLGLVLAASAVMVAAVSAIDGAWLSLYLARAARVVAA